MTSSEESNARTSAIGEKSIISMQCGTYYRCHQLVDVDEKNDTERCQRLGCQRAIISSTKVMSQFCVHDLVEELIRYSRGFLLKVFFPWRPRRGCRRGMNDVMFMSYDSMNDFLRRYEYR